jgi:hypothetical protein
MAPVDTAVAKVHNGAHLYLAELGLGIAAIIVPSNQSLGYWLAYLVIAALSVALSRAWELLSGHGVAPPASS